MIVLKTFDNYFSANIVLARLQQEGVRCYLKDEHTVTIDPLLNCAVGGIKLAVKKEDVPLAIELLEQYEADYLKEAACPRCQVHDMTKRIQPLEADWATKLVRFFIKDYHQENETIFLCRQCDYETRTMPDKYAYYNIP